MEIVCPEHFYKYRSAADGSLEFLIKQIQDDEVFFSAPAKFNDPFDCNPIFDLSAPKDQIKKKCEDALKKHAPHMSRSDRRFESRQAIKSITSNPERARKTEEYYFDSIRNKIGVYCLSKNPSSVLMWSHYADNHKGVCLEYDGLNHFFVDAFEVKYTQTRPTVFAFKDGNEQEQLDGALLTKSELWFYEEEWRMIYYRRGPGIYTIPHDALKRIIFGAAASKDTVDNITDVAMKRKVPPEISHATLSSRKFEILV